ncbi:glucose dehydrogenase [FAD, quinone] isoform X1 [Harpegnathos saltator]|uniref:Glucose dehydrogenase [acceptor] n=1 Tax=Harpegnathos saltator TaxID=610380 RepID=E2BJK0_HARSA|nr:glucose dehydrogenase [FAD, quinone] isoform X1 [Harpegnathos saltator]XP_019697169.1 glucose dehydrogenase [FAD, quinone] isoform X1 [Harpegnathos saltator]EFN84157.1 Glucose dehydrogenase [acceptor] [Harpegnathos saltator]
MEACLAASCAAATTDASSSVFLQLVQTLLVAQCSLSDTSKYPADRSEEIARNSNIEFDFVVVGAGSAGSIVARRLTEIENWKVLLIEAGDDPSAISEIPLLFMEILSTAEDYAYDAESDELICQGCKNKRCKWNKGKVLGGSSTINGMMYIYGNDEDYNEWSRMGNEGWSYEEVLPYFKKSQNCDYVHNDEESRKYCGHDGPMHLRYFNYTDTGIEKMFMDAARELNVPILQNINSAKYTGYGIAPVITNDGRRINMAEAFLSPIKDKSNLYVMKSSRADAILLDGTRAVGVHVTLKDGRSIDVKVSKEVILSAGSIASPQLLMLSGIGPRQHLLEMGISSVVDSPVGKNLQNHVGWQGLYLAYKNETARPPSPTFIMDETYQYLMHKRGTFATNGGFHFVSFVNVSDPTSKYADTGFFHIHYPQWHVDLMTSKIFSMADDIKQGIIKMLKDVDLLVPMTSLLKPKSRGELLLRSKDPALPVKIYAKSFSEQEDIDGMLKSLDFVKKILKTETFVRQGAWLHHLDIPGCRHTEPDSDEYWRCNLRHMSFEYFHPVGTAKMGPREDPTAVVDARLRVHGVQGLRVIDVSIMPTINSGTTMAPAMMIGEKGADLIKQDWLNSGQKDEL